MEALTAKNVVDDSRALVLRATILSDLGRAMRRSRS
jgi:hypothetical protein